MHQFYRTILWDNQEEMHCLVVLCLLSAAVALPTSEQLHTNIQALLPAPELKSEEKINISDEQIAVDPIPPLQDELGSEEAKNPSESAETPKAENNEDKDKLQDAIDLTQKESKESKESLDSKESKESKEFEETPEQPGEENKEKDSKFEESKEGEEEDAPIIVQVVQSLPQKGFSEWLLNQLSSPFSFLSQYFSKFRNGRQRDQPIYIVRESDFAYGERN